MPPERDPAVATAIASDLRRRAPEYEAWALDADADAVRSAALGNQGGARIAASLAMMHRRHADAAREGRPL